MGSMDQLKAIQTLINMKKSADSRRKNSKGDSTPKENFLDERYLPHIPVYPGALAPGRRQMPLNGPGVYSTQDNSPRLAVPDESINEKAKWKQPKLAPETFTRDSYGEYDVRPTYPMPVTPRAGPVRPTRPKPIHRPKSTVLTSTSTPLLGRQDLGYPKSIDEDMDIFKDKILLDKFEGPSFKDEDFVKDMKGPRRNEEDYEEAAKGIPMRRKRNTPIFFNALEQKKGIQEKSGGVSNENNVFLHKMRTADKLSENSENGYNSKTSAKNEDKKLTTSITVSSRIVLKLLQSTLN